MTRTKHAAGFGVRGTYQSYQEASDWRSITNDKEKYAAYLCSREWCEKREAVRERASGKCERCGVLPMDACHHLTYERKYAERLEDLQAICNPCHEFTHGKSHLDPYKWRRLLRFLVSCTINQPPPIGFMCGAALIEPFNEYYKAMLALECLDMEASAIAIGHAMPFSMPSARFIDGIDFCPQSISGCYRITGFDVNSSAEYLADPDEESDG